MKKKKRTCQPFITTPNSITNTFDRLYMPTIHLTIGL
jgi:hypothetical protein